MRTNSTRLLAVLAAALFAATACSDGPSQPTTSPPPSGYRGNTGTPAPATQPGTSASWRPAPHGTAGTIKPPPGSSLAGRCHNETQGWSHAAPAHDPHGPTPDQLRLTDVSVNRWNQSPCWDLVSFAVVGPRGHTDVAYSEATYVSRDQIVSDAQGTPLTRVRGAAVLRIAIKAPLSFNDGDMPPPGAPIAPHSQLAGSHITGVWYGGGQHNQSLFYIGLNAKRPLQVGTEHGPASAIVDVKFAR